MSTTSEDSGLVIYDGYRTRRLPWANVDAVGKRERHDEFVANRHTDGSVVVLPNRAHRSLVACTTLPTRVRHQREPHTEPVVSRRW